ncbi:MAG TPA: DUF418 domain-containing protein, partial [Candidatus Gallibacteroides avistercoris]|nr:DUF418 domain-containing protein [Candidatus Gallibacteroides avistercoris]
MAQNVTLSDPEHRIKMLDALRGFALLGILLVHIYQHFGIFSFGMMGQGEESSFPMFDSAVQWLSQHVMTGKFINIFAFLFGLSFFIQMDRAAQKGEDFSRRFLWRMLFLFVIGIIGDCFYPGDVLAIYAVFGMIILLLFRFKNKVLMIIVALLLLGVPRMLISAYEGVTKTEQADNEQNMPDFGTPGMSPEFPGGPMPEGVPMPAEGGISPAATEGSVPKQATPPSGAAVPANGVQSGAQAGPGNADGAQPGGNRQQGGQMAVGQNRGQMAGVQSGGNRQQARQMAAGQNRGQMAGVQSGGNRQQARQMAAGQNRAQMAGAQWGGNRQQGGQMAAGQNRGRMAGVQQGDNRQQRRNWAAGDSIRQRFPVDTTQAGREARRARRQQAFAEGGQGRFERMDSLRRHRFAGDSLAFDSMRGNWNRQGWDRGNRDRADRPDFRHGGPDSFPGFEREKPSFVKSVYYNLTGGVKMKLKSQFGSFGQGYMTLALFILGLVIGRSRFFEEAQTRKGRNMVIFGGFVVALLALRYIMSLFTPSEASPAVGGGSEQSPSYFLFALENIQTVLFSGALAMGFIVLYQMKGIGKCLDLMTPYGRMGLTNYEFQNIIGSILFSMWGLSALFGGWSAGQLFILGLVIYAVQILISKYWLKYY